MLKYTIKRIILMPILLLLCALLIFVLISLAPGEPAVQMLGAQYTQEDLDNLNRELGLDKPILVQYVNWVINAVQGDFGISYQTRSAVWSDISYRILTSIKLATITTCIIVLIGLPLGVMCAVKQYTIFDSATNVISKILGAIPGFWLGLMFIILFSTRLRILPTYGLGSFKHWILPVATLALPFIANYIRQSRSAMLDCIRQDYVRTARSKGNNERTVIFRDALRNALLPMITLTGGNFAMLLGSAVVVEKVYSIAGLGSKIVAAINSRDIPSLLACTLIISAFFSVVMLIIDLAYALVDPRIKSTFTKGQKKKKDTQKSAKEAA